MEFSSGFILGVAWSILGFLTALAYIVYAGKEHQQYVIESVLGGEVPKLVLVVVALVLAGILLWPLLWALSFIGAVANKVKGYASKG